LVYDRRQIVAPSLRCVHVLKWSLAPGEPERYVAEWDARLIRPTSSTTRASFSASPPPARALGSLHPVEARNTTASPSPTARLLCRGLPEVLSQSDHPRGARRYARRRREHKPAGAVHPDVPSQRRA